MHATQSLKGKFSVLRVAAAHAADGEASEHPQEQNEPHAFVDEKQEEEGKMKRIADEEQEVKATAATIAQVVSKEVTLRDLLRETKRHNDLFEDSVRTQKLQNAMMLLHVNTHMQGVFDAPNDQNALGDMHFKVSFLAASKGAMKDIVNAFEKPNPEVDEVRNQFHFASLVRMQYIVFLLFFFFHLCIIASLLFSSCSPLWKFFVSTRWSTCVFALPRPFHSSCAKPPTPWRALTIVPNINE